MTATKSDIIEWLEEAKARNATHLIIACDTFDWENYPVYVTADQDVNKEYKRIITSSMQRVDEVYNMSMDIESQLNERRAKHF